MSVHQLPSPLEWAKQVSSVDVIKVPCKFAPHPEFEHLANILDEHDGNSYILQAHGCRLVGEGAYSDVLTCPWDNTKVIKVSTHVKTDGWLDWAAYCIGHSMPMLPVIHNLIIREGFYVALLDRYEMTLYQAAEAGRVPLPVCNAWHRVFGHMMVPLETVYRYGPYKDHYDRGLTDELFMMRSLMRHVNPDADMHGHNVMIRFDGSPVITDPFGDSTGAALHKLSMMGVYTSQRKRN